MAKIKSFLGTGWSFPPQFDYENASLTTVSEEEDVRQSLYLLLTTTPGERVTNPKYGCDIKNLLFKPISNATKMFIEDAIRRAILRWEPRIDVESIEINVVDPLEGELQVSLFYTIRTINVRTNIVFPFYKNEGTDIVDVK